MDKIDCTNSNLTNLESMGEAYNLKKISRANIF